MKAIALKWLVTLLGGFAMYYAFFLGSVFYELYGPNARFCGTAQVWALQGAAMFFAPPALLGSVGLWFVGKQKQALGRFFPLTGKVSLAVLVLCAVINLAIFVPTL
jgi:streptogramin lyase